MRVVMQPQNFTIFKVSELKSTPKGNLYVECETDKGTIAVWGTERNIRNIQSVQKAKIPFKLSTDRYVIPSLQFPQHQYWIPEVAKIEIFNKREM